MSITSPYIATIYQFSSQVMAIAGSLRIGCSNATPQTVGDGLTRYTSLENLSFDATEGNVDISFVGIDFIPYMIYANVTTNTTGSDSTVTLRADGSDEGVLTIPAATTGFQRVQIVLPSDLNYDDKLDLKVVNGGGGNLSFEAVGVIVKGR